LPLALHRPQQRIAAETRLHLAVTLPQQTVFMLRPQRSSKTPALQQRQHAAAWHRMYKLMSAAALQRLPLEQAAAAMGTL
jgi:hypothetical protein